MPDRPAKRQRLNHQARDIVLADGAPFQALVQYLGEAEVLRLERQGIVGHGRQQGPRSRLHLRAQPPHHIYRDPGAAAQERLNRAAAQLNGFDAAQRLAYDWHMAWRSTQGAAGAFRVAQTRISTDLSVTGAGIPAGSEGLRHATAAARELMYGEIDADRLATERRLPRVRAWLNDHLQEDGRYWANRDRPCKRRPPLSPKLFGAASGI